MDEICAVCNGRIAATIVAPYEYRHEVEPKDGHTIRYAQVVARASVELAGDAPVETPPLSVGTEAWVGKTRQRVIEWAGAWDEDELPDIQLRADLAAFEAAIRASATHEAEAERDRLRAALREIAKLDPDKARWDDIGRAAIDLAEEALTPPATDPARKGW